ncbi:MAG: acyclic terpene utilization AtuA family protein [Christensenellales bacterium]|jgi:hypothetical protein
MKILALNGLLGYGYDAKSLEIVKTMDIDYIGVDAGSTDPGPFYLGNGFSFTNRVAVKRDIELVLPYALGKKIPFIIGTAGGSGGNVHVEWLHDIIREIAEEKHLSFRMAIIQTEVTKEYVLGKMAEDKTLDMSPNFELTTDNVNRCVRIVSQIGVDPIIDALKSDVDVVLCGRCCDTAIYAAPALLAGMDEGLAVHMAKIMECGALCAEPMAAADCLLATIEKDSFTLEPVNPDRKCTIARVAAHTMYEQGNPYYIYEPNGYADLRESQYLQLNDRAVQVTNSVFHPANQPTLKLEGAMLEGYRTITIAGVNDPETIIRIDEIMETVRGFVAKNLEGKIPETDYKITLHKYGTPLTGEPWETIIPDCSLGIIIEVVAKTQEIANTICALARARTLHTDYPGRKTSAGNLAFPYSPSDIPCGPVFTFGIYHLVKVDDLRETSKTIFVNVGE